MFVWAAPRVPKNTSMRWLLIILLLLHGSALAEEHFRLATWNVRNFFDSVDDPYGDEVLTEQQLEQKLQALTQVIKEIDADVIALQEVEKIELIRELQRRLPDYKEGVLIEGNDQGRGIDVALLSRYPLSKVKSHAREELPYVQSAPRHYFFSRDCLEVWLQEPLRAVLLVNHFKSKRNDGRKSAAKRRAQALGVMRIIEEIRRTHPQVPIAVLGDLNDEFPSWALEPLEPLKTALAKEPLEQRYTIVYRGKKMTYDHILLNDAFNQKLSRAKVWYGKARSTSDHYPVSADFLVQKRVHSLPSQPETLLPATFDVDEVMAAADQLFAAALEELLSLIR